MHLKSKSFGSFFAFISLTVRASALNVVLTNDDGWAAAMVRAQKETLDGASFNTILCAPADNESGTGSSDAPAKPLTKPCEFDTCATGSPAEGFNTSDSSLNYVNSFPVTAVRYGIQTLAPKFFAGNLPDIVVSGVNVGNNLGSTVQISGTVGAASEAVLEGVPAIAFSASTGSQLSYTTLREGDVPHQYSAASIAVLHAITHSGKPYLPPGVGLNVNYPAASQCSGGFKFVMTRILADTGVTDVQTCGTNHLPTESSVLESTSTCQSTISVFNATGKSDVDADIQAVVLQHLQSILSCI